MLDPNTKPKRIRRGKTFHSPLNDVLKDYAGLKLFPDDHARVQKAKLEFAALENLLRVASGIAKQHALKKPVNTKLLNSLVVTVHDCWTIRMDKPQITDLNY